MGGLAEPGAERIRTAYHEAGHGVIAYRFGHYGDRISIKSDGENSGSAQTEAESCDGSTDREQIVVLFAGLTAERVHDAGADPRGAAGDEERAVKLLRFQPNGAEKELRAQTAELVKKNWREIEAVATALVESETIDADEWSIIVDALDEGKDWREALITMRENLTAFRAAASRAVRRGV